MCTAANCGFQRGASFAASINTVCKCALRCLEMGPRCCLSAEATSAEVRPQTKRRLEQQKASLHPFALKQEVARSLKEIASLRQVRP